LCSPVLGISPLVDVIQYGLAEFGDEGLSIVLCDSIQGPSAFWSMKDSDFTAAVVEVTSLRLNI
jgi:hypothetical protein